MPLLLESYLTGMRIHVVGLSYVVRKKDCTENSEAQARQVPPRDPDQVAGDGRDGPLEYLIDIAEFDDLSVVENGNAVGKLSCQGKVVRDQHIGCLEIVLA